MNRNLDRILMAYRPMCQRGLLLDGQFRLPAHASPAAGLAFAVETARGLRALLKAMSSHFFTPIDRS